jgi:hypothetical protein
MASWCRKKEDCARDLARNDFVAYRQWFGLVPPEHEKSIKLGDLGRFNRDGEYVRLGTMFRSSDKVLLKNGYTAEKWVGVPRPTPESVTTSEEVVVDPFISQTTAWTHVPRDQFKEYALNPNIVLTW